MSRPANEISLRKLIAADRPMSSNEGCTWYIEVEPWCNEAVRGVGSGTDDCGDDAAIGQ